MVTQKIMQGANEGKNRFRPKPVQFDNLDDRREIHELLRRLPPRRRVQWLTWACRQSTLAKQDGTGIRDQTRVSRKTLELAEKARWDSSADERLTMESYMDVWMLAMTGTLNLDVALAKLVEMARGKV